MSNIIFYCPFCHRPTSIKSSLNPIGKNKKCSGCKKPFVLTKKIMEKPQQKKDAAIKNSQPKESVQGLDDPNETKAISPDVNYYKESLAPKQQTKKSDPEETQPLNDNISTTQQQNNVPKETQPLDDNTSTIQNTPPKEAQILDPEEASDELDNDPNQTQPLDENVPEDMFLQSSSSDKPKIPKRVSRNRSRSSSRGRKTRRRNRSSSSEMRERRSSGLSAILFSTTGIIVIILLLSGISAFAFFRMQSKPKKSEKKDPKLIVTTLKSIQMSQTLFESSVVIDQNQNGAGEYGLFRELTAQGPGRGQNVKVPYLSTSLAPSNIGVATKLGYYFRIYLPGSQGYQNAITDPNLIVNAEAASQQEQRFICYAWPMKYGSTGTSTFFITEKSQVFFTNNKKYTGLFEPNVEAGLNDNYIYVDENSVGKNGDTWVVWK
ncbi:DUF2950 family protein [Candidatus Uabimicrobium sp. HlEnr_7]|uniref:DUF2950 family protein n=1 Tax=Candidatus Uabimicrobium helgolandensis TaxID=3095367 RepID=UPI003557A05F